MYEANPRSTSRMSRLANISGVRAHDSVFSLHVGGRLRNCRDSLPGPTKHRRNCLRNTPATSGPEPCNSRASSSRPTDCSGDGFTNFTCQVTASYSITIGSGCTRRWAIDPQKNSSKRPNPRPNLEAQRWSFLRTKRTAKRILKDCWGRGLKRRPLPQTPTLARRCKDVDIKSETVPKVFVTL